ncbi:hypothetical protein [Massilibacteroides sp.]|uniref:hypothetical protein n=1 Tax=Massilibacteroides sp. TaxID=2034766 RepID=UPI002630D2BB|nr:hypothetical protein [Massilibacteroides sp.]MDD4516785.1 hypothetical protein [Massilibacteroides sp.]
MHKASRFFCLLFLFFILLINGVTIYSQTSQLGGTDGLGRIIFQNKDVGDVRKDAKVGVFYFLWQGDFRSQTSENAWDLHEIFTKHPEAFEDADHSA